MDFETAIDELAENDGKRVRGEEKEQIREDFDDEVDVEVVRQLIYSLQSVSIGSQQLLYFAGSKYGKKLDLSPSSFEDVFVKLGTLFEGLQLGRLEPEEVAENDSRVLFHESAFTFNGPEAGKPACFFVAGIIAGALKSFTGEKYVVNEVECCAEGGDCCEFRVRET